jgi:hypothetical protein
MAVLTTFKVKGDPDQLFAFNEEHLEPLVEPIARENGALEHIVCKMDDGLLVVNLWETLEGSERTAEQVRPRIEELAGTGDDGPRQSDWQSHEILLRRVVQP